LHDNTIAFDRRLVFHAMVAVQRLPRHRFGEVLTVSPGGSVQTVCHPNSLCDDPPATASTIFAPIQHQSHSFFTSILLVTTAVDSAGMHVHGPAIYVRPDLFVQPIDVRLVSAALDQVVCTPINRQEESKHHHAGSSSKTAQC
jgi:hypothetical protein